MNAIPVFAFHRVGPRRDCPFTVPPDVFDQYLSIIEDEGYSTLTCSELASIAVGRQSLPSRTCLLTFDDGYADTWSYAVPLLRRHHMRATVFVILRRLGSCGPRHNLEDYWSGRCSMEDLYQLPELDEINMRSLDPTYSPSVDHLSWEEVQLMSKAGTCEIQSHGPDHLVHYSSDRLVGFLNPLSHWGAYAAAKGDERLGTPVYEMSSSLVTPSYMDPKPLRDHLANIVARHGRQFFAEREWAGILQSEFDAAQRRILDGRVESEEEWERRTLQGLRNCIDTLSERIGPVRCLAWPFGAITKQAQALAIQAGFTLAFANRCGGYFSGMNPVQVGRFSVKEHDVIKFRLALRRYSKAEIIHEELSTVVYGHRLTFPV